MEGLVSLSFHWRPCMATEGGMLRLHVFPVRHLGKDYPHAFQRTFPKPGLRWLGSLGHVCSPQLQINIHTPGPLGNFHGSSHTWSWPTISPPTLYHPGSSFLCLTWQLLPLQCRIQAFLLRFSFIFNFIVSMGCVMGIQYFLANIHLSLSTNPVFSLGSGLL